MPYAHASVSGESKLNSMKLCVVQTRPVKGDIEKNIGNHKRLIELGISNGAELIIFPELSITGYEPELAEVLAINADDRMFGDFQEISNSKQVKIGVGAPTKTDRGVCISMILFHPNEPRQVYSKKYLHDDEIPFFVAGENESNLVAHTNIAISICYELSVQQHADEAVKSGAGVYIASAVKTPAGVDKAIARLSEIAKTYSMPVLFSNCIGISGGYECNGRTSAWNRKGILIGQLGETNEGILIMDTVTEDIIEIAIPDKVSKV